MGSLQSAILGYGIFKLLEKHAGLSGFTMEENVIVQTTAVATATMPLAAGDCPLLKLVVEKSTEFCCACVICL